MCNSISVSDDDVFDSDIVLVNAIDKEEVLPDLCFDEFPSQEEL